MARPRIPPELVADIIELTVELLIEEERHLEAHEPLSNRFLRSAALADRTWHSIANPILLKKGIVTSGSVVGFLAQIKANGMEATLESVRFGEASGGVTEEHAAEEDSAFDLLVGSLSGLRIMELVDSGAHFQTPLPPGRGIQTVHLSNHKLHKGGFHRKFEHSPPAHLVVTETRNYSLELDPEADTSSPLIRSARVLQSSQSLAVTMGQTSGVFYFAILMMLGDSGVGARVGSRLQTCRVEITTAESFREVLACIRPRPTDIQPIIYNYSHLEHLATHLLVAYFLLAHGTHPRLTSLELLNDPEGLYRAEQGASSLNPVIFKLLANLPRLENLKRPARWASDEVREWCEAKGVTLLSS